MDHEYSADCNENGEAGPCRECFVVPDDRRPPQEDPSK